MKPPTPPKFEIASVACGFCGALAGDPCVNLTGSFRPMLHHSRSQIEARARAIAKAYMAPEREKSGAA